ncbi:NirD/YgiW/YdeI family stress tolerance protein [Shewanella dokdonensis]|uniref:NirD/YgiW/YdeI family stress tolerance protein n=1 Tax=Shewanella dokdonensis TaxID=712036 RepID=A0ABX8DI57_9GAMM|nr:NirD/YgiW/YdeI family stress tolerance protein [Shewanella dokdonensis]MCL1076181.1 NirD/YgiW/YdeI family stress tolerance protein [Shewanella dokdonensis]QVK24437.1 NirD/YgiW/YdeI family stress tolerance protein [Shewanella dokdonensis]
MMTKRICGILMLLMMAAPAVADAAVTSAHAAQGAKLDTQVALHGYLIKALGDQHYLFRDHSGELKVEIDNALWRNVAIKADTPLLLTGKVGNTRFGPEVEIEHLQVADNH